MIALNRFVVRLVDQSTTRVQVESLTLTSEIVSKICSHRGIKNDIGFSLTIINSTPKDAKTNEYEELMVMPHEFIHDALSRCRTKIPDPVLLFSKVPSVTLT